MHADKKDAHVYYSQQVKCQIKSILAAKPFYEEQKTSKHFFGKKSNVDVAWINFLLQKNFQKFWD